MKLQLNLLQIDQELPFELLKQLKPLQLVLVVELVVQLS